MHSEGLFISVAGQLSQVNAYLNALSAEFEDSVIREVAAHIIGSGGKRVRPALAIVSSKLCGFSGDEVIKLGAAIELLHTATLIHDDVLDGANKRRGRLSINKKWGNHISVLAGDTFFCMASSILAKHTNLRVVSLLSDAMSKTTEGEVLEIVSGSDISTGHEEYLKIIEYKTARLISAACEAGAILADAPSSLIYALKNYGLSLGMAFQIVDDIIDYFPSPSSGKDAGIDLKEGKLTLPLIYALQRCSENERSIIKEALISYSESAFKNVGDILEKYSVIEEARKAARGLSEKARSFLEPFRPSIEKESLESFAEYVTERIS